MKNQKDDKQRSSSNSHQNIQKKSKPELRPKKWLSLINLLFKQGSSLKIFAS